MDVHNLATLFGPNILHKAKGGLEYEVETVERAEERKDVISILEELIHHQQHIFTVSLMKYNVMNYHKNKQLLIILILVVSHCLA